MAHITTHLRRILGDIAYADRRSFELRTGIDPRIGRRVDNAAAAQIAELNATYALHHQAF